MNCQLPQNSDNRGVVPGPQVRSARIRLSAAVALIVATVAACALPTVALAQEGVDPLVPGQSMARIADRFTVDQYIAAFEAEHPEITLTVADQIPGRPSYLFDYTKPDEITDEQVAVWIEAFVAHPSCVWGEILYEGQSPEGKTGSTWTDALDPPAAFIGQYAVDRIGLPQAHERSTGQGVVVAVLDTGIDATHPELAGRVLPNGYNFIHDNTDTGEISNGHGTYVAGLIRLVAPDAKLLPIVVLDEDGKGDGWSFAKGLYYAIDQGVEVINLSLGSTYKPEIVEDAVEEATNLGIVVVSAAGNFDREEPEEFPAAMSDGFGVAAVDHADFKAPFSNYNDKLFLSAPGNSAGDTGPYTPETAVYSTIPGGGYAVWEGTSFSTAFVSGAVALVRAQYPQWGCSRLTYDQIEMIFENTSIDIDDLNPQYAELLGEGRLHAGLATGIGPVAPGPGDFNSDGVVDGADLALLLGHWNSACSSADLNGDGTVDGADLALLLGNWG